MSSPRTDSALKDSLRLLQSLQETAERSWRAYEEGDRYRFENPPRAGSAGTSAITAASSVTTPPTKATSGEADLELQLSSLQRRLAEVWRRDLEPSSSSASLRASPPIAEVATVPRPSPPITDDVPMALTPSSLKSPNRLQSPFRLGAGACAPALLSCCPVPRPPAHLPTIGPPPNGRRAIRAPGLRAPGVARERRSRQRLAAAAFHHGRRQRLR